MNTTTDFRYPGSRPFNDTFFDRRLFFGRNHEKASLLHMVLAENLVILFAKSGMGKTSLLNAGLMQPLRQREYIPFMIRLNIPDIDPLQAVYKGIKDAVDRNRIEYTAGEENTLWQYFKTVEFWSSEDTLLKPVLILDQFEELFTLHSPEKRKVFITQLADLVKDRVPKDLRKSLKPGERFPYSEISSKVKIIISIREDFLGQLEELAYEIPDILHNRFRLIALTREQAKEAIVEPARLEDEQIATANFQYAFETVEAMLDFFCERRERKTKVRTDEVEPFQLQLLCQHIESKISEKVDKEGAADIIIQKDDLGGEAGMQRVLKDFYDNQINRLDSLWKKRRVRRLCEKHLISDTDRRLSLEEEKIERKYKVSRKLLTAMVDSRLLRAEPRVGSVYYELSHDTLVEPIRKSQSERRVRRAKIFTILAICLVIINTSFLLELKQRYKINEIYREAGELKDHKKFTEAIEKYKKILEIDKDFAQVYVELGGIYSKQKNFEEAIKKYNEAIELDEAIKLNPELTTAYIGLGDEYSKQEKFKDAVENYEKALSIDDKSTKTYRKLFLLYLKQGEVDQAIEVYGRAVKVSVKNAYIYTYLDRDLLKENKGDEVEKVYQIALEAYEEALKTGDKSARTFERLASLYIKLGDIDQAIKVYGRAVKTSPKNAYIYTYLVRALKNKGMEDQVDRIFEIASKVASKDPTYYINFGNALMELKRYDDAIQNFKKAVQLNPEDANAYNDLGRAFNRLPNYPEAKESFKKAMELSPGNIVYQKNFAEVNLTTGDFEKAFEWAHKVLKAPNISMRDRLPMGFISISSLLFQGKRPEAFAELKKFIADLNALPKGYRVFGWSYNVSQTIIKNSTQLEESDKTLLLDLIGILKAFKTKTNQKQKLEAFERYLSEISEQ